MLAQTHLDHLSALERIDEEKSMQMASMAYGKCTQASVVSCNVSWKGQITAGSLVGILAGKIPMEGWEPHIETFFNELPHKFILGVMKENGLTLKQLTKIFETLPEVFQEKNFKELIQHA